MASRILSRRRFLPFVKRMNERYDDGWVHRDICARLERFSDDVAAKKSPRLMLLMPPRHGKALAVGTLIPTPQGLRSIESLHPGDEVFGRSGAPTRVIAVSEVWRDRPLFEVMSDDGASVIADAEHEWTVRLCRKHPVFHTKTTARLAARTSPRAPALMTYGAAQTPAQTLPIDPYVLGVWLGDGCAHHATITQGDEDYAFVRAQIDAAGMVTSDRATEGTFGVLGLSIELRRASLLNNKHIPDQYLHASPAQRLALLQGLVDTDGHVAPDGQVEVCGVNEPLMRGALQLVRSLGVKASLILGRATLYGRDCGAKYRVMFYMKDAARLPRKAARCRDGTRSPHRFLTFNEAGRGDTVCIQVEAADHQFLAGPGYLLTHNSELASRNFPAWHLGRHPNHEFIACSYNLSLAMSFSRKVKQLIDDPLYKMIFDTRLDSNNQSTEEWAVAGDRGGYVAAGTGGGITGKGADILVIDDPVRSAEDADSGDGREKVWEWYMSTAYTRLAPGAGVLVIMTWWHDDDLAGRLQQMMAAHPDDPDVDQFEVIKYPAIAVLDEYLDPVTGAIVYEAPTPAAVPLRLKGEALHPTRYDLPKLNKIRALNRKSDGSDGRWWSALYQQNPVPDDGSYFTKEQFRRRAPPHKSRCNVFIAWDFAISEKKQNDYTVGTVGLQDEDDVLHIADVVRFRSQDAFFIVESILDLAEKWYSPTLILGFEDGQIYKAISAVLKKRMLERKIYPAIEVLVPITDKMARARAIQGRMQQGMVSFHDSAEWYDVVKAEMLRFPAGVHDDCVDSLAWVGHLVVKKAAPRRAKTPEMKSWRDKLKGFGTNSVGHMSA